MSRRFKNVSVASGSKLAEALEKKDSKLADQLYKDSWETFCRLEGRLKDGTIDYTVDRTK